MAQQSVQDMELKQYLKPDQFLTILRQTVNALENNREFQVTVNDRQFTIPAGVLQKARKLRVEYEVDEGEHELEFTLKWC